MNHHLGYLRAIEQHNRVVATAKGVGCPLVVLGLW